MKILVLILLAAHSYAVMGETIDELISQATQPYSQDQDTVKVELDILYRKADYEKLTQEKGRSKRKAERDTRVRWTNNVVPYTIASGLFSSSDTSKIKAGMAEWERYTCLKFKQRYSERNYINIAKGNGCSSYVGMIGGSQRVSLDYGCIWHATIVHELGHAIGFQHEQTRPDRDSYVTVVTKNLMKGSAFNFEKYSWQKINDFGVPYDYRSVMHYGPKSFSRNGQPTIVTKDSSFQNVIGNAKGLSFRDIKTANLMYKCAGHCGSKSCPGEGFLGKDCVCYCPGSPLKVCSGSGPGPTNPPPTRFPENCFDNLSDCPQKAANGQCDSDPNSMHYNCRLSCNKCGCQDYHTECPNWANYGMCSSNESYMKDWCKKSCSLC